MNLTTLLNLTPKTIAEAIPTVAALTLEVGRMARIIQAGMGGPAMVAEMQRINGTRVQIVERFGLQSYAASLV